jgi:hypothetical protein
MDSIDDGKFLDTLMFFKALGDQTRLKIVSILMAGERNVGELATLLNLTEPTVSHHLSKLRPSGIVTLRFDGNQRFYSLNTQTLQSMGQKIVNMDAFRFDYEVTESDYSWLDALNLDDFARKTLRHCTENQRLVHIPRKQAKLIVVLEWLVTFFERDHIYTEREINEILKQRYEDYASLRRDLVDMGYLRRDRSGSTYLFEGSFLKYFQ